MTVDITRHAVGPLMVSMAGRREDTPMLFLHGIGSSGMAFDPQLGHFGEWRWCLAPDAPGYADSDDDPTIDGLAGFVAHYVAMLDRLEVEQVDLLGLSWGGVISARFAATNPERVRRLVLIDTSRGSGTSAEKAEGMLQRPVSFEQEGAEGFSRSRTPRLLAPAAPAELFEQVAKTMADAIRFPGYRQAAVSMAETDHTDTLRTIQAETLVIVGREDVVCPPEESELIADLVPGATLTYIDDAGHLSNQEQPAAFNRVVEQFLGGAPTDRSSRTERTP